MKTVLSQRAALLAAAMFISLPAAGQQQAVMELTAGINVIRAEVAYTFPSRAEGLMHRQSMGTNQGMLFVFTELDKHCMWMKNTLIPLAVAFIDEKGAILNVEEMAPQTENSHCASGPARYALEMNKEWFKRHGLGAGTKIQGIERAPQPQ
jgi:uncharacterized protein